MYKEPTNKEKHASAAKNEAVKPKESLQLEDKRASSTVQKKVHTIMQNYSPKHVIQPKKNTTGLPDNLKDGIEQLSGQSLDDVHVHFNSSKPAQLNAHAYAQGNAIHLASGQEKQLPHEAWHVVQQKQGRVKPTTQTKENIPINDNQSLEKEADIMGAKALQLRPIKNRTNFSAKNVSNSTIIQPKIIPYKTNYKGDLTAKFKTKVTSIASKLDQKVQQAYRQSLQWRSLEKSPDKFVNNWYKMAQAFAKSPDLKKEPKLMYARFGYSVEAIATAGLNNKNLDGLIAKTQVSHGHTRPDIVLVDPLSKSEVAWLDITSEASIGHIDGKDGAGWANRPFIFEIVYPKLQIQALLNATNDPYYKELGVLLSNEKQIELDTKLKNENLLRKQFITHRDKQNWKTGSHNATKKRQETRDFFMSEAASEGVEEETNSMKNTRGALEYLGINPGPFGFNRGNVKPTNERIVHVIHEKSKKEIQQTQNQLYSYTSGRIFNELKNKIPKKLANEFFEELSVSPTSKELSLALMAMKGALTDFPRLDAAKNAVKSFTDPNDNRAKNLEKELDILLKGPQSISHMAIMNWRNTAQEKTKEGHQLSEIAKLQRKLILYSQKQDWNMFNRPRQITKWLQELAASPLNVKAAQEVQKWLNNPTPLL